MMIDNQWVRGEEKMIFYETTGVIWKSTAVL